MEKLDRFKKRQELKQNRNNKGFTKTLKSDCTDYAKVEKHINSYLDTPTSTQYENSSYNKIYSLDLTESPSDDSEVKKLLRSLKSKYDKGKLNLLKDNCKKTVLDGIIGPFGIGKLISESDIHGGNVDTVHNVRNGVFSTKKEQEKYENNKDKHIIYHCHKNYKEAKQKGKLEHQEGNLINTSTGKTFQQNETPSLDHTISGRKITGDAGRILANINKHEIANKDSNLNHLTKYVNQSKGTKSTDEFIADKNKEIMQLENKVSLTISEKQKLKEFKPLDDNLLKESDAAARKEYDKEINSARLNSSDFHKDTFKSGAKEGSKMGLQQAMGVVLKEFTEGVFEEVSDIFKNGFRGKNKMDNTFFTVLKKRLTKISNRIMAKWKDVLKAFGEGFFSGFLSNLVTVIVNMFVTTRKRVVRIIREGIFSLLKALKMLFSPPKDMTFNEAFHEATKLLTTGILVSGGIFLEEYLEKLLGAVPFSNMISTVISGIVTGLGIALIVYLIDKMDVFGVEKQHKNDFIMKKLTDMSDSYMDKTEDLLKELGVILK